MPTSLLLVIGYFTPLYGDTNEPNFTDAIWQRCKRIRYPHFFFFGNRRKYERASVPTKQRAPVCQRVGHSCKSDQAIAET